MTRKFFQLLFILTYLSSSAFAQFVSFEEEIPCNFKSSDKQELALSSSYYKEGSKSLEWNSLLTAYWTFHPNLFLPWRATTESLCGYTMKSLSKTPCVLNFTLPTDMFPITSDSDYTLPDGAPAG